MTLTLTIVFTALLIGVYSALLVYNGHKLSLQTGTGEELDRLSYNIRLNVTFSIYIPLWISTFALILYLSRVRFHLIYSIPLLWPLLIYCFRLWNVTMKHRRQSAEESKYRQSVIQSNASMVISSIIGIGVILNAIGSNDQCTGIKSKAAIIIMSSVILSFISSSMITSDKFNSYHALYQREIQSMMVNSSAAIFLLGVCIWFVNCLEK